MSARKLFTSEDEDRLIAAINTAERNTSGEIRVHIDATCSGDPLERAKILFVRLKMDKTALRNGVLFYVASESQKLAVYGDEGIDKVVPPDFWNETVAGLVAAFKKGDYADGLVAAILSAGQQLGAHFPLADDDTNELSNDLTYDDE